jgi:hypothetical protein
MALQIHFMGYSRAQNSQIYPTEKVNCILGISNPNLARNYVDV